MRSTVAIVGSHTRTRDNAPWGDPDTDIWVFNEAGAQPWVKGRVDAVFQMHTEPVYKNPVNRTDKQHWQWLQMEHPYPIYMQASDPEVPASVAYPIDEVIETLLKEFTLPDGKPIRFFTSTIAYAIALAVYKGYKLIRMYGIEAESNTEYTYQRPGVAFWTGLAVGRGIAVEQNCGEGIYVNPLYGYDGEAQLNPEDFIRDLDKLEESVKTNEGLIKQALEDANLALKNKQDSFEEKWRKLMDLSRQGTVAAGILREARRYHDKVEKIRRATGGVMIPRQEYEINAARSRQLVAQYLGMMNFESGRAWYTWNLWKKTGNEGYLDQFKKFAEKQLEFARKAGEAEGMHAANQYYMKEVDDRIKALGGQKALSAYIPEAVPA